MGLTGPRCLDAELAARVKPTTLKIYGESSAAFANWSIAVGLYPITPSQWDDCLMEFKHANMKWLTKQKFVYTVTSVEFFFPSVKGHLAWSHSAITGWQIADPVKHTVPLGITVSRLVAIHMSSMGYSRLGIGLVVQAVTGIRPNEMLGIVSEDVSLPSDMCESLATRAILIALAPRTGTKMKRPQTVSITNKYPDVAHIIATLRSVTPPKCRLFPYSIGTYRRVLKVTEARLGLKTNWSPQSSRYGFASDLRAAGVPFTEIKELGRWAADASLRVYLDIVTATSIAVDLQTRGLGPAIAWSSRNWLQYFPLAAPAAVYQR